MLFFKNRGVIWTAVATVGLGFVSTTQAALVTPDIIFGTGNANGSFTVTNTQLTFPNLLSGNIELGLRAKLRYDESGEPKNQFNWDGVDTYSFDPADGNPPANRAMWNFEWSVNIEGLKYTDGSQVTIPELVSRGAKLELSFDIDPGASTSFVTYNLFNVDAWYGTNATANGGGSYNNTGEPVAGSTVAQNSVNYGFIPGAPVGAGIYDIKMTAFSFQDVELASTSISVKVLPVPEPGTLAILALGLTGLVVFRRRRF